MSEGGLVLAVPSKGRLEEQTRKVFADAQMTISRPGGARSYAGAMKSQPQVTVRFYPAGEIARELIRGTVDIGVTGLDLIEEGDETGGESVILVKPLGFGNADVVVAVPDAWIDVTHMVDLADVAAEFRGRHGRWLRVATKYANITRRHFGRWGISEYRLVESAGATEAAPASGSADVIVDITSTGSTLTANSLRILEEGVVLKSEAHIIVSRTARWTPLRRAQLEAFLTVLGGVEPGMSTRL